MATPSHSRIAEIADPARWVDLHGDALLRYAAIRIGDRDVAEDLVQETLLAAWRDRESFDGRASFRTWLIGILRRKIADVYRRSGRELLLAKRHSEEMEVTFFDARGKWKAAPANWTQRPDQIAEDSEFWSVLATCIAELPSHLAEAFESREISIASVNEICAAVNITPKNLSVRLHRARLLLRRCLELNWFSGEEAKALIK